jgi:hypothetical protein
LATVNPSMKYDTSFSLYSVGVREDPEFFGPRFHCSWFWSSVTRKSLHYKKGLILMIINPLSLYSSLKIVPIVFYPLFNLILTSYHLYVINPFFSSSVLTDDDSWLGRNVWVLVIKCDSSQQMDSWISVLKRELPASIQLSDSICKLQYVEVDVIAQHYDQVARTFSLQIWCESAFLPFEHPRQAFP